MEPLRYSNMEQKNLYQKKVANLESERQKSGARLGQQLSAHATPRQAASMPS